MSKEMTDATRKLAKRFPPGSVIGSHEELLFVVGYADNGALLVSDIDPKRDYEAAVATRKPICECCQATLQKYSAD